MTLSIAARTGSVVLPGHGALGWEVSGPASALALLLIRPLGGTMALWEPLLDALGPALQVIRFDAAGTGASRSAPARRSIPALAHDALRVLDHLRLARVFVYGQSLGSFVALHLASTQPERVQGLLLASAAIQGASFVQPPIGLGLRSTRCLLAPAGELEVCLLHHILRPAFRRAAPELVCEVERMLRADPTPRPTLVSHLLAAARYRGRDDAQALRCPVQLAMGAEDRLLGTKPQRALCRALRADCATLAGAGHELSLEAPGPLAALVHGFIQRVSQT